MDQRSLEQLLGTPEEAPPEMPVPEEATQEQEIPELNLEDVDLVLREHLNRNGERDTIWIKVIDVLGVTLFPMLILRILRNIFSFICFSDDILEDTDSFLTMVQDGDYFRKLAEGQLATNSLISKFGKIIYQELLNYQTNPSPMVARYLTVFSFYLYTVLTSAFMMISFVFLLFCLTYTIGKRWSGIHTFWVLIAKDSVGIL